MPSPLTFATNFLKEPYPTMGMAPSASIARAGATVVQEGGNGILQTGQMMWARIASGVPFGWTIDGLGGAIHGGEVAGVAVQTKIGEGAQAVDGFVKTISDPIKKTLASGVSTVKWLIVGLVAVAFIVFAAQVKTLVKS